MILRFDGFHRQPSLGVLRCLLYLEVCESRSAPGIESEITTFRKSLLALLIFFGGQKIFFVSCGIGSYRSQSQHIAAQASHPLATYATLLRARRLLLRRLELLMSIGTHTSSVVVCPANTCMETSLNTNHNAILNKELLLYIDKN